MTSAIHHLYEPIIFDLDLDSGLNTYLHGTPVDPRVKVTSPTDGEIVWTPKQLNTPGPVSEEDWDWLHRNVAHDAYVLASSSNQQTQGRLRGKFEAGSPDDVKGVTLKTANDDKRAINIVARWRESIGSVGPDNADVGNPAVRDPFNGWLTDVEPVKTSSDDNDKEIDFLVNWLKDAVKGDDDSDK
jgi:hypothetical protein